MLHCDTQMSCSWCPNWILCSIRVNKGLLKDPKATPNLIQNQSRHKSKSCIPCGGCALFWFDNSMVCASVRRRRILLLIGRSFLPPCCVMARHLLAVSTTWPSQTTTNRFNQTESCKNAGPNIVKMGPGRYEVAKAKCEFSCSFYSVLGVEGPLNWSLLQFVGTMKSQKSISMPHV